MSAPKAVKVGPQPASFTSGSRRSKAIRHNEKCRQRVVDKVYDHETGCSCRQCRLLQIYTINLQELRGLVSKKEADELRSLV